MEKQTVEATPVSKPGERRKNPILVYCTRICTPNILLVLLWEDGRKVGLGAWIYFSSTLVWLYSFFMNAIHPPKVGEYPIGLTFEQYAMLVLLATVLIGGGTVVDNFLDRWKGVKSDPPPPAA